MSNATHLDRKEAQKKIRAALKELTGRAWSVTGGKGTAWGWIKIHAFPREREDFGYIAEDDQETLRDALDLRDNYPLRQRYSIDPRERSGFVARLEARAGL